LKRLVLQQFATSGQADIEHYLARIVSEKAKFYDFMVSVASNPRTKNVTVLSATQSSDSDISTPLLPPDYYLNRDLQSENNGPVEFTDAKESRSIYQYLSDQPKSNRRKRSFVYGALYKNLIGDSYALIDCKGKGRIEINVEVEGHRGTSKITILDSSDCVEMLKSVATLGKSLGHVGNSRKNAGDCGEMWGLGYRSKANEAIYVKSKEPAVKSAMKKVCECVSRDLGKQLPESLDSIRQAEAFGTKCPPLPEMGGAAGPGSCIMISKNLGNSVHFDYNDGSMSFGIWVEERIGVASNWYFVMPNIRLNGKLGVVIRLFHGCVISWDGRLIKHCTSVTETGESNNVYGCMFGSCRP
jgi:hypothetical protein